MGGGRGGPPPGAPPNPPTTSGASPIKRSAAVLLLAAAFLASGYLLLRSITLLAGGVGTGDVCSTVFARGCDETLQDPSSRFGGIPLAGWGVIHFGSLLLLLALGRLLGEAVRGAAASAAAFLALAGGVASLALLCRIAAGSVPFCPLCLVVHGLGLAAVVPILRWRGRPVAEILRDGKGAAAWLLGREVERPEAVPLRALTFACTGLVAVILYQWILIEGDRALLRGKDVNPEKVVALFAETPVMDVPVAADDPSLGPATARSTLVVFSDAFCPSCRGFWSALPRVAGRHGRDLRVVFKHFPLDPACNSMSERGIHPHACAAGVALEAARKQDKFWQFLAVVESPRPQGKGEDVFLKAAKAVGLDIDRFQADIQDPAGRARLERDVALGQRLGVEATPTMFLDGRRIENATPKVIEILLAHLLGKGRPDGAGEPEGHDDHEGHDGSRDDGHR